jgi:hypothetical protein
MIAGGKVLRRKTACNHELRRNPLRLEIRLHALGTALRQPQILFFTARPIAVDVHKYLFDRFALQNLRSRVRIGFECDAGSRRQLGIAALPAEPSLPAAAELPDRNRC